MKRTYIDANVLIAAFQGTEDISRHALNIIEDPERILVVSDYLRLEVLPKPTFHRRQGEIDFMQTVLDSASENLPSSPDMTQKAVELASRYDIAPMDALHVGAAAVAEVDELVTMENPTKPMFRVQEIKVTSLLPTDREP